MNTRNKRPTRNAVPAGRSARLSSLVTGVSTFVQLSIAGKIVYFVGNFVGSFVETKLLTLMWLTSGKCSLITILSLPTNVAFCRFNRITCHLLGKVSLFCRHSYQSLGKHRAQYRPWKTAPGTNWSHVKPVLKKTGPTVLITRSQSTKLSTKLSTKRFNLKRNVETPAARLSSLAIPGGLFKPPASSGALDRRAGVLERGDEAKRNPRFGSPLDAAHFDKTPLSTFPPRQANIHGVDRRSSQSADCIGALQNLAGILRHSQLLSVFLLALLALFFSSSLAQELQNPDAGSIQGRVVDSWSGDGLPAAAITVRGTLLAVKSDNQGAYSIEGVPPGNHILIFSKPGYGRATVSDVRVAAGQTSNADVSLNPEFHDLEPYEVVVEAFDQQGAALLDLRQSSAIVMDAIGSDFFSKAGAGDAAEIMSKVTGATVVGGKYVFIRGLGERYGNTTLNGNDVPSADPDKKSVQMDIFPADVIDNIVTSKTFTPDQPGSFTGGSVNIITKSFPEEFFFKLSLGGTYNTQSSLNEDFLSYEGGGVGAFGIAGEDRELPGEWDSEGTEDFASGHAQSKSAQEAIRRSGSTPEEKAAAEKTLQDLNALFAEGMGVEKKKSGLDGKFSANAGNTFVFNDRKLGLVGGFDYDRGFSFQGDKVQNRFTATTSGFKPNLELDEQTGIEDLAWSGLFGAAYQFSDRHTLDFNFLYSRNSEDAATFQRGKNLNGDTVERHTLHFTERELQFYHVRGRHNFPELNDLNSEWNVSLSTAFQNEPDLRFIAYTVQPDGSFRITPSTEDFPKRIFRYVQEDNVNFRWDTTMPLEQWSGLESKFKFGYYFSRSEREFQEDAFNYIDWANLDITNLDLSRFTSPEQIRIVRAGSGPFAKDQISYYVEQAQRNVYAGEQAVSAGYFMFEVPLHEKWRLVTGVRAEKTDLSVNVRKLSVAGDPPDPSSLEELHMLPAASLIYEIKKGMNVRLAYGATVARPTFKEIADVDIEEFVNKQKFVGNPDLEMTTSDNFDLRWEWFPRPAEVLAASLFYKKLENPIEPRQFTNDGQIIAENREQAILYGFELEARKSLDFIHDSLGGFTSGFNFTYVESEVDTMPFEFEHGREDTRPLVGQSPYIANFDLSYANDRWGTTASVFYNIFGERIAFTAKDSPRIKEQPFHSLDFTLSQRLSDHFKLKFSAKNLLDSEVKLVSEFEGEEAVYSSYTRGRSFGLSLSYEF